MTRQRLAVLSALAVAVTACSDTTSITPPVPDDVRPQLAVGECSASVSDIRTRIRDIYPADDNLETRALARFDEVRRRVSDGRMAEAVTSMFGLVDWTLLNYRGTLLVGGQSELTQQRVTGLVGKLYCYVRLPAPSITAASLGPDAAAAVVYPNSPDTLIKTETDWAEVFIPAGAIPGNQPVLVTIQRIPESQYITPTNPFGGPLVTSLNQYPLYYQYSVSPAVTFNVPVTVGICLEGVIDLNNPPGSRLRVAHNISATSIEILPWAAPPALNCGSIATASAASAGPVLALEGGWGHGLRLGLERALDWLLPPPAQAAPIGVVAGTCCLGGATRTFTPFGGVDTLGFLSAVSDTIQDAWESTAVAEPPSVRITGDTAQGAHPLGGIPVAFRIISGTGTINGVGPTDSVMVITDPNGVASLSNWTVSLGANQVRATPHYVPGTGFTPASVVFDATGEGWASLGAGNSFSCGLSTLGRAYCWGQGGRLGDGTTTSSSTPVPVAGGLTFTLLSVGDSHACGLTTTGAAYCWGNNNAGQLGAGLPTGGGLPPTTQPMAVSGGLTFSALAAGLANTCAIDSSGAAYCWGSNIFGQLGSGASGGEANVPSLVVGSAPLGLTSIAAGWQFNCGVTAAGATWCWGQNGGAFANGGTANSYVPAPAVTGFAVGRLALGNLYRCILTTAGAPHCWGSNVAGEIGTGTTSAAAAPTAVAGGLSFVELDAHNPNSILAHTCGVTAAGAAWCWGSNQFGQLGGTSADQCTFGTTQVNCSLSPVAVSGGLQFVSVAPGITHTCGLAAGARAYCWGQNFTGQLGNGTLGNAGTPVRVSPP